MKYDGPRHIQWARHAMPGHTAVWLVDRRADMTTLWNGINAAVYKRDGLATHITSGHAIEGDRLRFFVCITIKHKEAQHV